MNQRALIILTVVLAVVAGLTASIYVSSSPQIQHANLYPQPRKLAEVALIDQHGEDFTQDNLLNHWTLAFVGYTSCPDICPTTLAELKRIYPEVQKIDSDYPIQIMFMSVDPNRDTTQKLKQYIDFFNPEFIAATAEHSVLFPLVRSMGMMYSINGSTDEPDYEVGHSGSVVIINPLAQVIGRFKPEMAPGQLPISDGEKIIADMPSVVKL